MKKKQAFTLIELLVVISIILILVGLTSAGVRVAIKKAKNQKARTECMALLAAVNKYYSETGIYPKNSGSTASINEAVLGKKLSKNDVYGTSGETDLVFGPYYDFKESNSSGTIGSRNPVDPWGNNYEIVIPEGTITSTNTKAVAMANNGFSVIYSTGPDGSSNTDDDIGSWQ